METKGRMDKEGGARRKEAIVKKEKNTETFAAVPRTSELLVIQGKQLCDFNGYDADVLMDETAKLRKLITKRGTLEILIPLCCTTNPVRYLKFRNTLKGFSSKTLAIRLKELEKAGILKRQSYHEIPPRVEYNLTNKGQELVESVISLLQWMQKWSNTTITSFYQMQNE
jgi:DNA-binding HxlR family transcriptional regulator